MDWRVVVGFLQLKLKPMLGHDLFRPLSKRLVGRQQNWLCESDDRIASLVERLEVRHRIGDSVGDLFDQGVVWFEHQATCEDGFEVLTG